MSGTRAPVTSLSRRALLGLLAAAPIAIRPAFADRLLVIGMDGGSQDVSATAILAERNAPTESFVQTLSVQLRDLELRAISNEAAMEENLSRLFRCLQPTPQGFRRAASGSRS